MTKTKFVLVSRPCFDDPDPAAPPAPPKGIEFTAEQQEHINKLLAENKRTLRENSAAQAKELETLKKNFQGTAEEKQKLAERIDALKRESMTEKEQLQSAHTAAVKALHEELDTTKKKGEQGWKLYRNALAGQMITTAAVEQGAFNPQLVVQLLDQNTVLEPTLDDSGNQTGEFKIVVNMQKTTKDGKVIDLKLSPSEAVKLMTEQPEKYGSLFKSTAKSGTGGHNTPGTGTPADMARLARENPAEYMRLYRESRFGKKS